MSPRLKRRKNQRGALIVEFIVVAPLLIMLMGVGWWFWEIESAQSRIAREAAQPVFATATYGCGQAGETSHAYPGPQSPATVSGGSVPMVPADMSQVYQAAPGAPNDEVITRSISDAKATTQTTTEGFRTIWFEPKSANYQISATMLCNEAVHDGQLDQTKRIAAAVFNP